MKLKKLILTLGFSILVNMTVNAADVVCEKDNGWYYPKNAKAKIIAEHLKVKTCSGRKFIAKVKELGLTTNAKSRRKNKKDLRKALGI